MTTDGEEFETRIEAATNVADVLVIQVGTIDPWQRRCGANLHPIGANAHQWDLRGLTTEPGFEHKGWGRRLLQSVRDWAAPHGWTVRTRGALPELDDFYRKCGCHWDDDEDEWIVVEPVARA